MLIFVDELIVFTGFKKKYYFLSFYKKLIESFREGSVLGEALLLSQWIINGRSIILALCLIVCVILRNEWINVLVLNALLDLHTTIFLCVVIKLLPIKYQMQ